MGVEREQSKMVGNASTNSLFATLSITLLVLLIRERNNNFFHCVK